MSPDYWESVAEALRRRRGVGIEPGLSEAELAAVERALGFRFPADLREMLATFMPAADRFPNWRGDVGAIREWLDFPLEGLLFDVVENALWPDAWGERPASPTRASDQVREAVRQAPTLVPVYGHRFMPCEPEGAGNPVFSVMQSDIIYYGYDLPSYLSNEFKIESPRPPPSAPRKIRFWADLVIGE